jgi:hypothetical protein
MRDSKRETFSISVNFSHKPVNLKKSMDIAEIMIYLWQNYENKMVAVRLYNACEENLWISPLFYHRDILAWTCRPPIMN